MGRDWSRFDGWDEMAEMYIGVNRGSTLLRWRVVCFHHQRRQELHQELSCYLYFSFHSAV